MMRNNILEALIGALVLVMAAFFLIFAYNLSQERVTNQGYELQAAFNTINGIVLGGDVKLAGIKVGTVSQIDIDRETYQAIVTVLIRSDLKIPDDSSAEIISESFLGNKYVGIIPGGSDTYLQPGARLIRTQSSLSLEALISKFIVQQGAPAESRVKS